LAEVPVMVRDCSDEEMLALALVENLQREDLNPMEAARSYQQLVDEFGLSQAEVAVQVGKSRSAVANTLRLLALPAPIQGAVAAGTISEGHGRALLAASTPDQQMFLFQETVTRGLSVRAVEALVATRPASTAAPRKKASPAGMDANLLAVQEELQRALGVKVRFRPGATGDKGVIEIEYYTADDLERIYETLGH
jgi:ParB family chromosome partitioning protein